MSALVHTGSGSAGESVQQFAQFIARDELWLPWLRNEQTAIQLCDLDRYRSADIEWQRASGKGRLAAWTIFHRRYDQAFDPPYNVAIVRLLEGAFILSTVIRSPGRLVIGMPLRARFESDHRLAFEPDHQARE